MASSMAFWPNVGRLRAPISSEMTSTCTAPASIRGLHRPAHRHGAALELAEEVDAAHSGGGRIDDVDGHLAERSVGFDEAVLDHGGDLGLVEFQTEPGFAHRPVDALLGPGQRRRIGRIDRAVGGGRGR